MSNKHQDKINKKTLNTFKRIFNFGIKPNAENPIDKIQLYKTLKGKDEKGNSKEHLIKEVFPDGIKALFKYWLNDCHDNRDSWQYLQDLYDDMDMLYYNCAPIAKAIEIISDEVLQADSNNQKIFIEAKPKIKKAIEELFDDVGLDALLRPTVSDIVQFGNAGWILGFDNSGVNEVIQINPRYLKERMEFSPYEINNKLNNQDSFLSSYKQSVNRIDELINMILNKENSVSYFKTYLLGFVVEDSVLPPWKFIHFRNTTNKSPFKPMGVPLYIHAMAPYRQYDAAMGLQVTARGARFPKSIYKLKLPPGGSVTEKFQKATEFMNQLLNSGFGTSKKELPGIGEVIVTIDELYDFQMETPDIELGQMDDVEMLRDEILDATLLPRRLIDPKDSGFGESGVSYLEQFKPFARLIYRFQSILLENISQMVKIHLIHSGKFALDEIDFILSMPYPESQTNNDIISSQSSLLDLANSIIETLQDRITDGEKLPPELVKTIYNKFLPYDTDNIDYWIDEALKAKEDADEDSNNEADDGFRFNENWKLLESKVGKRNLKEEVDAIILEKKLDSSLKEGSLKGRHFISSRKKFTDFDILTFEKLNRKKDLKFVEKEMKETDRSNLYEEYKFEADTDKKLQEEVEKETE